MAITCGSCAQEITREIIETAVVQPVAQALSTGVDGSKLEAAMQLIEQALSGSDGEAPRRVFVH